MLFTCLYYSPIWLFYLDMLIRYYCLPVLRRPSTMKPSMQHQKDYISWPRRVIGLNYPKMKRKRTQRSIPQSICRSAFNAKWGEPVARNARTRCRHHIYIYMLNRYYRSEEPGTLMTINDIGECVEWPRSVVMRFYKVIIITACALKLSKVKTTVPH